jgi:ATP-dependent RNA helicase DHX37/DHR1
VFENFFPQDSEPEILRMPIEGVVLTMKSMGIDSVVNFPFPSQPDRQRLAQAEKVLVHLGALKEVAKGPALINELGKTMNLFPLAPRYAKMLVVGRQHGCLPYIIAIVSALSVGDPFLSEDTLFGQKDEREEAHDDADDTPKGERRRQARKAYFTSKEVR